MKDKKQKNKNEKGFTLIEALTLLFIFSIITLTFYNVIVIGSRYIVSAKNRLGAVSVANEKMETIRNLKYDDVGTVTGAITGKILDVENITENANHFKVQTTVEYTQDPFDGLAPDDTAPEDYKKVTVKISWNNDKESTSLVSRFVPTGLEVAKPGDGFLRINVFSDQPGGTGIPNSSVHVVNNDTGLDTTVQTDSSGSVILMGDKIKNSIKKYRITLAKSGYENVTTMPPYPAMTYNPVDVDASVVTGSMNVANIVQDELATMKVDSVDFLGNSIPSISFHMVGGRIIGNTIIDTNNPIALPVYNLDADATTGSGGEKDFGSVSPGQYTFTLGTSVSNYVLIDTDPVSPSSLFSNQNLILKAKLAAKNVTSLLVKVVASDGVTPVAGAQVELKDGAGYDVTETVSSTGTVFFPTTVDPFLPGTYDLKVTASGFSDNDSQVMIDQDQLKIDTVTLSAS